VKIESPFKHEADFEHMEKVLMRQTKDGPVPIFEGSVDAEIACEILDFDFPTERVSEIINIGPNPTLEQLQLGFKLMEMVIAFYTRMGYDYVTMAPIVPIPRTPRHVCENPQQQGLVRVWQEEGQGIVSSREEFEVLPWPPLPGVNVLPLDHTARKIPPQMKMIAAILGIFEDLRSLLGIQQMAVKSVEDPEFVEAILEKLCLYNEAAVEKCAAHPAVGAVIYGDDLGFNRGTMMSPDWIRHHLIPRYKRMADACHRHGKPFLFHSCGQIDAIMEDLIETVGIDGRHSFQDNIEPVEQVYRKYGDRISILGGLDVDLLARGTEAQVRKRTRQTLEACAPGGGFCMGSGNSVTNFCKIENYFAMLDETQKWNEEHA